MGTVPFSAGPRLSLFYITQFLVIGIGLPFWPLWLSGKGLDAGELGVVLAGGIWVRVASAPLLAMLADRHGGTRRPILLMSLAAFAATLLFATADGFWALLAVSLLAGAGASAIMPLADGLTARLAAERRVDYGRVRLWGSLAFIAAAVCGGSYLAGRPSSAVLTLLLVGWAMTVMGAALLPEIRQRARAPVAAGLVKLLADRRFLLFLAAAGLIQASHAALNGFATLHWLAAGHDRATVGWLWAEGVVAEIAVFAVAGALLRRVGGVNLLVLGGAAAVLRWLAVAATSDLLVLVPAQTLHGLTFALCHAAAMDYLARRTPAGLMGTAQALYVAIPLSAMFGLATLFAGSLYEWTGAAAFLAMAALAFAGTLVAAILARLAP